MEFFLVLLIAILVLKPEDAYYLGIQFKKLLQMKQRLTQQANEYLNQMEKEISKKD